MTTSTGKKTFDICGSENAISFMDKYKTMAQDFVLHCYSKFSLNNTLDAYNEEKHPCIMSMNHLHKIILVD